MKLGEKIRNLFHKGKPDKAPEKKPEGTPEAAVATRAERKEKIAAVERQPQQLIPAQRVLSEQRAFEILRAPHISEKSVEMMGQGLHVFEVALDATRSEIKAAVEKIFDVEVVDVRVANFQGKRKKQGVRSRWRKAHVRLAEGQTLDTGEVGA